MKQQTLRQIASEAVVGETGNAITKSHERNYEKLHVWRDGSVSWREYNSKWSDIIDQRSEVFAPVPSIACVGTGGVSCDCDWCADGGTVDVSEVDSSELDDIRNQMMSKFDAIPVGYFDDEATV